MSDSLSTLLPLSLPFVLHLALLFFSFLLDCCYVKLGRVQTGINTESKNCSLLIHFRQTIALADPIAEDSDQECKDVGHLFVFFLPDPTFVMTSNTTLHWQEKKVKACIPDRTLSLYDNLKDVNKPNCVSTLEVLEATGQDYTGNQLGCFPAQTKALWHKTERIFAVQTKLSVSGRWWKEGFDRGKCISYMFALFMIGEDLTAPIML